MDDLISRRAAIKAIGDLPDCHNGFSDTYDKACIIGVLEELPSVQPERKKGKWLRDPPEGGYALYKCSVCGKCWPHWYASAMTVEKMTKTVRRCPNCGADMREETTDEAD